MELHSTFIMIICDYFIFISFLFYLIIRSLLFRLVIITYPYRGPYPCPYHGPYNAMLIIMEMWNVGEGEDRES